MKRWLPWIYALVVLLVILLLASSARAQAFPDRQSVLNEERARFGPTVTKEQIGLVMARTAWRLRVEGFGLLRKDGGNVCAIPNSAVTVSCDWLVHLPSGTGCDVLGAADDGGPATPRWCAGEPFDTSRFLAPVDPGDVVTPPVDPPADNLAAILLRVETRLAALEAAVKQLPSTTLTFPIYEGSIRIPFIGTAPVTLTPKK